MIYIAEIIIALSFPFLITGYVLDKLREKIKKATQKLPESEEYKCDKNKALHQANLLEFRTKNLRWLTITASFLEFLLFFGLTLLLFTYEENDILAKSKIFAGFFVGWMALKALSTHGTSSDPSVGKAYYYISLIGTLINVSVAACLGYILLYLKI